MTTNQQLFRSQGYLVLEEFNTPDECNALMKRGEELAGTYNFDGHASVFQTADQAKTSDDYFIHSADNISFFFEKDAFDANGQLKTDLFHSINKIGHALHDLDPLFNAFSRSSAMKKLAAELMLDEYVIIQSMLILKHARVGGNVDIHQDATFLYTEPVSCIGFWFALEDASAENGCLWAKPGGHLTKLRTRFRKKETGAEMQVLDNEPFSMEGMIPLEVKKGTCIVLDGLLPHCSLPNTSSRSRQAYAIHAIDRNANYPVDNWLQRDIDELRGFS
ncbi:MAG: phytanoyl-CoA dioxygenase family protein [Chitinophagaceae bacterium]|nr:phytanoyl-CoA dioxygenase family protein [Chitinophagaceae bacterium]